MKYIQDHHGNPGVHTPVAHTCDICSIEKWKTIPGYPNHEISTFGSIRSKTTRVRFVTKNGSEATRLRKGKLRKIHLNKNRGYLYCNISGRTEPVHRIMASTFISGCIIGLDVDHIDGNKTNNKLCNLRVVTRKENINNPNTATFYLSRKRDLKGRWVNV